MRSQRFRDLDFLKCWCCLYKFLSSRRLIREDNNGDLQPARSSTVVFSPHSLDRSSFVGFTDFGPGVTDMIQLLEKLDFDYKLRNTLTQLLVHVLK